MYRILRYLTSSIWIQGGLSCFVVSFVQFLCCAMTRKYPLCLFFLCGLRSLAVDSTGEGFTNPYVKLDDGCNAEITVVSGTTVVKEYPEEEREEISKGLEKVVLSCKPDVGFQGMQAELSKTVGSSDKANFTAEELRISPDSRWYEVTVTLIYKGEFPEWGWYVRVSVNDGEEIEKLVRETPISSRPTTLGIRSIGPSKWRFSQSAADCYNQKGQNTDSTDENKSLASPEFILAIVFGVAFSVAVLISIVFACKIKYLRAAVPPQANREAERQGNFSQTENAIYGYPRQGYVPRY